MTFKIWTIQLSTFKHHDALQHNEWGKTDQQTIINGEVPRQGDTGCNGSIQQEHWTVWGRVRWKDQEQLSKVYNEIWRMGSICQENVDWVYQAKGTAHTKTYKWENMASCSVGLQPKVLSRAWQAMRQLSFSFCFWELCLEAWPRVSLAFPTILKQLKTFVFSSLFAIKTDQQNCSYEDN